MATISQPESMQLVIDRVGAWKVIYATLLQLVARAFGRRGAFYEVLGEAIAAFDGYTGTMPPYERAIVLAPRDPRGFARSLSERTGIACAVVDANDLGKAKVLGSSTGVCDDSVARRRCSTIRTATATSRRRSSCSSGADRGIQSVAAG